MKSIIEVGGSTCAPCHGQFAGIGRTVSGAAECAGVDVGDGGGLGTQEHEFCSGEGGDGVCVGELAAFAQELLVGRRDAQGRLEGLFEVEDGGGYGESHGRRLAFEADLEGDRGAAGRGR